ncbi:hypothetical protein CEV31_1213 [Brucella thiophenivorans]|uniref:Uncharacterized protein n=1 Tax=Brucella thiophenivorans TaxID=571255 RepID=A0A256FY73_9HYPH|nr:hypothetical protein CEV31_1213 [Brucella thiophenivorans]
MNGCRKTSSGQSALSKNFVSRRVTEKERPGVGPCRRLKRGLFV